MLLERQTGHSPKKDEERGTAMKRRGSGKIAQKKPAQAAKKQTLHNNTAKRSGGTEHLPDSRVKASNAQLHTSGAKPVANKPQKRKNGTSPMSGKPAQPNKAMQRNNAPLSEREKKQSSAAMKKRSAPKKSRRGSRGGNYSLYYILGAVVLVIVFVILANTVLFDCTVITVEGNASYASEEIAAASGIKKGDNLLKADLTAAGQNIVSAFPYIDIAEVKRTSPTRVTIKVTEAEKMYCMRYGTRSYIISRRGKVLEQGTDPAIPVVLGFEAQSPAVGSALVSAVASKTELPNTVLLAAEKSGISDVTILDISDRFGIRMEVEGRITLLLGNITELEGKMNIAAEFVNNIIGATESVTIDLTNPEKVPVRDNNIIDSTAVVPIAPESSTDESTSESAEQAE
ncbi:MAG: cell division protein FtsQ/DivIB [Oscillospiraceae bacterium]